MTLLAVPGAASVHAQRLWAEAGAGVFGGDRPTYNGPVFHLRFAGAVQPGLWLGARATYRDDDPSSGRARSYALLGESILLLRGRSHTIYVPAGLGLEWMTVTTETALPAGDAKPGAYGAVDLGLGIEFTRGARRVIIEGRQSFRAFGGSRSLSLGLRSYSGTRHGASAAVDLAASVLHSLNGTYTRDKEFQGYAVAYVHPLASRSPSDIRVSLGVDFLEFTAAGRSWSTGSVTLAPGAGWRVAESPGGTVRFSVVTHVGFVYFAEPSGQSPAPLVSVGGELRVSPGPLGVVGAYDAVVAGGPAGTLTAARLRLGLGVAM